MSMAIVIGPTPPGFGVIFPATGWTAAKSTSPTKSVALLGGGIIDTINADVDDCCARLDHVSLDEPGYAHSSNDDIRPAAMLRHVVGYASGRA